MRIGVLHALLENSIIFRNEERSSVVVKRRLLYCTALHCYVLI